MEVLSDVKLEFFEEDNELILPHVELSFTDKQDTLADATELLIEFDDLLIEFDDLNTTEGKSEGD